MHFVFSPACLSRTHTLSFSLHHPSLPHTHTHTFNRTHTPPYLSLLRAPPYLSFACRFGGPNVKRKACSQPKPKAQAKGAEAKAEASKLKEEAAKATAKAEKAKEEAAKAAERAAAVTAAAKAAAERAANGGKLPRDLAALKDYATSPAGKK